MQLATQDPAVVEAHTATVLCSAGKVLPPQKLEVLCRIRLPPLVLSAVNFPQLPDEQPLVRLPVWVAWDDPAALGKTGMKLELDQ
jgi:hypothetical protein